MIIENRDHIKGALCLEITQIGCYPSKEGIVVYVDSDDIKLGGVYTPDHIDELALMFSKVSQDYKERNHGKD